MATDKRHIKTQLRREILKTLALTVDPELRVKMQTQLIDLLGENRANKLVKGRAAKGAESAKEPVQPVDSALLGV